MRTATRCPSPLARAPKSQDCAIARARLPLAASFFALSLLPGFAAADTQTFTDGVFPVSCWTSTKIVDTTPSSAATFVSTSPGAGGNPANYRDTKHTFGLGTIIVAHMNACAWYDPSTVPIAAIDVSYDLIHFTGISIGGAVAYRLALLQNGTYYGAVNDDIFSTAWTPFAHTTLQAGNFVKIAGSGPDVPDFRCTGAPIRFGFLSGNSQGGAAPVTKHSGLDNWSVTLHLGSKTFIDGSFGASWTSTKILDTTPASAATFTSTSLSPGGNPTLYRETTHTYGAGIIEVAHINSLATHDPSMDPLISVDFSYDLEHLTGVSVGGAVAYRLALLQGGLYYHTTPDNIFATTWTGFAHTNYVATDFTLVTGAGPINPDFSATGSVMQFGFTSANSQSGTTPVTKTSGLDNWRVKLHTIDRCTGLVGTPFCFCQDGPCGNSGAAGNGCANSVSSLGAHLTASGNAQSLFGGGGPDTVQFTVTGTPLTSPMVLFKGNPLAVPGTLQSGRLCCGAPIRRLVVKSASGGGATFGFPNASEVISILGQSPPGQTACYQVWYRDPMTPCVGLPSNLTNGYTIVWF